MFAFHNTVLRTAAMSDLQSDTGAGGASSEGTVQVEMFNGNGATRRRQQRSSKKKKPYGDGLKAPSPIGKNFVLDTNVLLHDPDCLDRFGDNHICIPIEVLCELDRFKGEQTERGANTRNVHRSLADIFSSHPNEATIGIPTVGGGSVRLVPNNSKSTAVEKLMATFRGQETNDNRILICASMVAEQNSAPTILITKDLNLQLKAHAVGIPCEDYQNDKVDSDQVRQTGP